MVIYFGADHRGFELKNHLQEYLRNQGYQTADMGATRLDAADDYPTYASAVAKKISLDPEQSRGVLVCGSGSGVDIVANKFPSVRSVLAISPDQVYAARKDDNVNVLSLAADFTDAATAEKILQVFMATVFSGEARYRRRLEQISKIESEN
ncbi:MAG: RpiB/LacA/LacB family sugar-phosphate isomerase [Patescibacteria group bacterium]